MLRLAAIGSLVLCASLAACGGSSPRPGEHPTALPVGSSPASESPLMVKPGPSSRRAASAAIKRYWPFDGTRIALYADLETLMKTKTAAGLVKVVTATTAPHLTPEQQKCLESAVTSVKELAAAADEDGMLMLVRFDPASSGALAGCLGELGETRPVKMEGAAEAWRVGKTDVVALPAPGILVVSSPAIVARALSLRDDTRGAARLEALALGPGEHLTWTADLKRETISGRGTLLASDERFRLEAKAELPNEEIAKEVEARFAGGPMLAAMATAAASGLDPATKDGLNRLMKAYDFRRDGKHVAFTFDLREPPAEQARDLGAAAALAVYGFRKYIASAKQAEARNTLGHLAKSIVMVWEMEDGRPQAKKRLASFPAVPKAVPKGVKYQSTPADWKPWAPLKFEMTTPQYYQYEVKAAKDGLSAEILARGDLDGDGKTSLFRMTVTIRKSDNAAVVSPSSDESDPDE